MSTVGTDDWADAPVLAVGQTSDVTPNATLTNGADEPSGSLRMNRSAWWMLQPTVSEQIVLDTQLTTCPNPANSPDTTLILWQHDPSSGAWTQVAYNDDFGSGYTSLLLAQVTAGATYYVSVAGYSSTLDQNYVLRARQTHLGSVVDQSSTTFDASTKAHADSLVRGTRLDTPYLPNPPAGAALLSYLQTAAAGDEFKARYNPASSLWEGPAVAEATSFYGNEGIYAGNPTYDTTGGTTQTYHVVYGQNVEASLIQSASIVDSSYPTPDASMPSDAVGYQYVGAKWTLAKVQLTWTSHNHDNNPNHDGGASTGHVDLAVADPANKFVWDGSVTGSGYPELRTDTTSIHDGAVLVSKPLTSDGETGILDVTDRVYADATGWALVYNHRASIDSYNYTGPAGGPNPVTMGGYYTITVAWTFRHADYQYIYPGPTTVTHAPPLRQWPRSDALGASSARRLWPLSPSIQASNRRVGGYL